MILYPALDLMDGRPVRLTQGRFDEATRYAADPAEALTGFAAAGATWAHVVDLDGARASAPRQHDLLAALVRAAPLQLQVAGGVRTRDHVARLLDVGAGRVVVGSLAVSDPDLVGEILAEFGAERITLAFDVRLVGDTPRIVAHGWSEETSLILWEVAGWYDATHLLLTDVARDGMLAGPNSLLVEQAVRRLPAWRVQASGGVATLADLAALKSSGCAGAIVGKALWERRFSLAEALDLAGA